jgi:hypothetical protein
MARRLRQGNKKKIPPHIRQLDSAIPPPPFTHLETRQNFKSSAIYRLNE